jgi:nucleoid-associated protein YgaU
MELVMASFQQISIALVCVVAAFAFGNYVNNHSPTDPNQPALQTQADIESDSGKVQSRLTVAGLDIVEKRPAPIATMRQPIQSRFGLPASSAPTSAENSIDTSQIMLPPPSQLANSERSNAEPMVSTQAVKQEDIPDFSSIMAEIENSPIAAPHNAGRLGNMPNHSDPIRNLKAIAKTDQQLGAPNLVIDQPDFTIESNQRQKLASNWNTTSPRDFSDEDFEPRLRDRLDGFEAKIQSNGQRTTQPKNLRATGNGQSLAESFGFSYSDPPAPIEDADSTNTPYRASVIGSASETTNAAPPMQWNQPPRSAAAPVARIKPAHNPVGQTRSNHVVSRQPLPDRVANRINSMDTRFENLASQSDTDLRSQPPGSHSTGLAKIPNRNSNKINNGESVFQTDNTSAQKSPTMLPFGLNDQGKSQLVAIKTRASTQLESTSTRFVNHVIQPGETLQSISKRYFGKPDFYLDIYLANRTKLNNPVDTPDGTAIRIPVY